MEIVGINRELLNVYKLTDKEAKDFIIDIIDELEYAKNKEAELGWQDGKPLINHRFQLFAQVALCMAQLTITCTIDRETNCIKKAFLNPIITIWSFDPNTTEPFGIIEKSEAWKLSHAILEQYLLK
ncbi:MAG: hypothetical protein HUK20_13105 [Fibrobacter sp.]|nr:hypothetical protein [Fibrobacter sp.]